MQTKLDFIRAGGCVKRYHTLRTIQQQNVAEHSFGVAWLCCLLANGTPSRHLLMAALRHDLAEHVTGDVPAPVKRSMGLCERFAMVEYASMLDAGFDHITLTKQEERILKLADTAELLLYCIAERELGNVCLEGVYARGVSYVAELAPLSSTEKELFEIIWRKHAESE